MGDSQQFSTNFDVFSFDLKFCSKVFHHHVVFPLQNSNKDDKEQLKQKRSSNVKAKFRNFCSSTKSVTKALIIILYIISCYVMSVLQSDKNTEFIITYRCNKLLMDS